MDDRKMEIIKQLMQELQEEMDMSSDDFTSRLGREKPQVEVAIESEEMPLEEEGMEEDLEMGPEDKLKSRLMKLRG